MPTLVHVQTAAPIQYLYSPVEVVAGERVGHYLGLWDTAALHSCVSPQVVADLGLVALPQLRRVTTLHHTGRLPQYAVHLRLGGYAVDGIQALAGPRLPHTYGADEHIDVLLGMDVLRRGDLVVSYAQGRTQFRFRMPAEGLRWG